MERWFSTRNSTSMGRLLPHEVSMEVLFRKIFAEMALKVGERGVPVLPAGTSP
jgi:hypothetical protein